MSTLITLIQHIAGSSSQSNKAKKGKKRHRNHKEEIKVSLFEDDMTVYTENPNKSLKKAHKQTNLLELTSEFCKATDYKRT